MKLWIARDKDETLWLFKEYPIKKDELFYPTTDDGKFTYYRSMPTDMFPEVTFENSTQEIEIQLVKKSKMTLLEVLPQVFQYENIPYATDFNCQECGRSGFFDSNTKPNIVGWCETNIGYMIVFECPLCYERYRFHGTIGTWSADKDEFEYYLHFYASQCANWEEIKLKLIK